MDQCQSMSPEGFQCQQDREHVGEHRDGDAHWTDVLV